MSQTNTKLHHLDENHSDFGKNIMFYKNFQLYPSKKVYIVQSIPMTVSKGPFVRSIG